MLPGRRPTAGVGGASQSFSRVLAVFSGIGIAPEVVDVRAIRLEPVRVSIAQRCRHGRWLAATTARIRVYRERIGLWVAERGSHQQIPDQSECGRVAGPHASQIAEAPGKAEGPRRGAARLFTFESNSGGRGESGHPRRAVCGGGRRASGRRGVRLIARPSQSWELRTSDCWERSETTLLQGRDSYV